MRIAFDVKGTLEGGNYSGRAMNLLLLLHKAGHEVIIWSSVLSYAYRTTVRINQAYGITLDCYSKYGEYEREEKNLPIIDFAVEDDTSQDYLAAKNFVWVHNIPENVEELAQSLGLLPKVD